MWLSSACKGHNPGRLAKHSAQKFTKVPVSLHFHTVPGFTEFSTIRPGLACERLLEVCVCVCGCVWWFVLWCCVWVFVCWCVCVCVCKGRKLQKDDKEINIATVAYGHVKDRKTPSSFPLAIQEMPYFVLCS